MMTSYFVMLGEKFSNFWNWTTGKDYKSACKTMLVIGVLVASVVGALMTEWFMMFWVPFVEVIWYRWYGRQMIDDLSSDSDLLDYRIITRIQTRYWTGFIFILLFWVNFIFDGVFDWLLMLGLLDLFEGVGLACLLNRGAKSRDSVFARAKQRLQSRPKLILSPIRV